MVKSAPRPHLERIEAVGRHVVQVKVVQLHVPQGVLQAVAHSVLSRHVLPLGPYPALRRGVNITSIYLAHAAGGLRKGPAIMDCIFVHALSRSSKIRASFALFSLEKHSEPAANPPSNAAALTKQASRVHP